ncbi:MAG: hypothetical protein OEY36_03700 [Gammaproteobacteria bacterium]|nr:hypothetical protein [Gammaproteobacteria bacterium]
MTVMLWRRDELIARYEFEAADTDQFALNDYLENSKEIPASIILDVLEEEVMLTTIPHVAPHERKFLIERKLARLKRSSSFSTSSIIGRDDSPRKDDRLLISSLTSDDALLKWLDIFNQHEVMIRGVYSLPLIASQVLKVLKLEKGLVLLVSRQSRDFIRQSIYKDGKIFYSRNIPSSQNLDLKTFSEDIKKTKKYLENQKLLVSGGAINVLVLASDNFFAQLKGVDELLPEMQFSFAKYNDLKRALGFISSYEVNGREIFASLLLNARVNNHYARKSDLQIYRKKQINSWLSISSIAVSVLLVMASFKLYLDTEIIKSRIIGLDSQLSELISENNRLSKDLSRLSVKPASMRLFVENINELKRASSGGVDKVMIKISGVFAAYPNIELKEIKWAINEADLKQSKGINKTNRRGQTSSVSAKSRQAVVILASVVTNKADKQALKAMVSNFIHAMEKLDAVDDVRLTKAVLNDNPSNGISGVISDKANDPADFSFVLTMKDESLAG